MKSIVPEKMKLTVLFFSVLREKLGRASMEVSLEAGATGADLLNELAASHDMVDAYRSFIRLAVNTAYEPETVELQNGDEVALITPVSGG